MSFNNAAEKKDDTDADIVRCVKATEGLSETTVSNYLRSLRKAQELIPNTSLDAILTRPEFTVSKFNEYWFKNEALLNTRVSYISWLRSVYSKVKATIRVPDDTPDNVTLRWERMLEPMLSEQRELEGSNIPTARQEASSVMWADIVKKNLELRKTARSRGATIADSLRCLLSSMYTDVEPRRQSDYYSLFIARTSSPPPLGAENYVDLRSKPPRLVVGAFKTKKSMGTFEEPLPPEVVDDLLVSLKLLPRSYVFVDSAFKQFQSPNAFAHYHNANIKRWFGPNASCVSLRRARSEHIWSDTSRSFTERAEIARKMGHKIERNLKYSSKTQAGDEYTFDKTDRETGEVSTFTCKKTSVKVPASAFSPRKKNTTDEKSKK